MCVVYRTRAHACAGRGIAFFLFALFFTLAAASAHGSNAPVLGGKNDPFVYSKNSNLWDGAYYRGKAPLFFPANLSANLAVRIGAKSQTALATLQK